MKMLEEKRIIDVFNDVMKNGFNGELLRDEREISFIIADFSDEGKPYIMAIKGEDKIVIEKDEGDYKVMIYSLNETLNDQYYITGIEKLKDVLGLKNPKSLAELNKDEEGKIFVSVFNSKDASEILEMLEKLGLPFSAIIYFTITHDRLEE